MYRPVEAKVRCSGPDSTNLLIRARDVAVQAEFAELSACEFPIWTSAPVLVEIPPEGTKRFVVGAFSGSVTQKTATGDFPNVLKFPVYRKQTLVGVNAYDQLRISADTQLLTKMPLAAVATVVSGVVDGRLVQSHCVLPLWHDGSAVLVSLDWMEGEPAEGTPNPEWYMRASSGVPARLGLEQLHEASKLPPRATHCHYQVHFTPWVLGAALLEDKGQETMHRIWQREWTFDRVADFSDALDQIRRGLVGIDPLKEAA